MLCDWIASVHMYYLQKIIVIVKFDEFSAPQSQGLPESLKDGSLWRPYFVRCHHFQMTSSLKLFDQLEISLICSFKANGERKFIYLVRVT